LSVSRENDWTGWCLFFLEAIVRQADSNIRKAKDILALYEAKKLEIVGLTKSQYAIRALDFIFDRPVFKSSDFVKDSGIPKPTALRIARVLVDNKILTS